MIKGYLVNKNWKRYMNVSFRAELKKNRID